MIKKAALVRYICESNDDFTNGQTYQAYFLEYWQGVRNSLHVRNNSGAIVDFIPFENFDVINDVDSLLTLDEAIVRCITHTNEDEYFDLTYGNTYHAIGRDKDGMYLVMDDSCDC